MQQERRDRAAGRAMSAPVIPAGVTVDAVAAAKAFLRIEGASEDALIARFAGTAFALGEAFTGHAFIARGFEDVLGAGRDWQRLAAAPVSAIAGLTALPIGAAPVVLASDAYAIDIDVDGDGWVRLTGPAADRVTVSYTAGLAASWDALPAPLAQGVIALIAHLFADREGATVPPAAVAALWRPFRRMTLAPPVHAR